jgi:hypothetical protein
VTVSGVEALDLFQVVVDRDEDHGELIGWGTLT